MRLNANPANPANPANRFDGVPDYQPFALPGPGCAGLCDVDGVLRGPAGSTLAGCTAGVALAAAVIPNMAAGAALRIVVTVRCPGTDDVTAEGIRIRHAPLRG